MLVEIKATADNRMTKQQVDLTLDSLINDKNGVQEIKRMILPLSR
jgi:hypothetical protein